MIAVAAILDFRSTQFESILIQKSSFCYSVCEMSKTYFHNDSCGGHLGFPMTQFELSLIQKSSCCYSVNFCSNQPKVWEEMLKIDFQDGGSGNHLVDFRLAQF